MKLILALLCLALSACNSSGSAPSSIPAVIATPDRPAQTISRVVFIGDSITMLWPLDRYLTGAVNAGVSGDTTDRMLARFDTDVLSHHPSVVVILGGINDIKNTDAEDPQYIFAMVQRAMASGAKVIVGTVMAASRLPRAITENQLVLRFNEQLRMRATEYGYTLVEYHTAMQLTDSTPNEALLADGLHPNDAGFNVMWSVLRPELARAGAL